MQQHKAGATLSETSRGYERLRRLPADEWLTEGEFLGDYWPRTHADYALARIAPASCWHFDRADGERYTLATSAYAGALTAEAFLAKAAVDDEVRPAERRRTRLEQFEGVRIVWTKPTDPSGGAVR